MKKTGLPALCILLPAFLWLCLTCCIIQAAALPLLLLGRRREYIIVGRWVVTLAHSPLLYLFQYSGSKITAHGKDVQNRAFKKIGYDQSIMVVNHRGDLDWLVGLLVVDSGGGVGASKAIIKSSLVFVPFFGFIWWAVDFIRVSRSWEKDEKKLQVGYKRQHLYREEGLPFLLCIFPEGTRLTQEKLEASQDFLKKRGKPNLEHVLCPRTKGVWSAMNGMRLDTLIDATMSPGSKANMMTLCRGEPCNLAIHIDHVELADVPRDEDGLGKWLFARWEIKEKRLDTFKHEGHFGKEDGNVEYELKPRPRVALIMHFAIVWWLVCQCAFASWCIRQGRTNLLTGFVLGWLSLLATVGFVLYKVHFQKHGKSENGKAKAA